MSLRHTGGHARLAGLFAIILVAALTFGAAPLNAARRASTLPTIGDIQDLDVGVNGTTGALDFTVGDAETASGSLIVTATSSDQTLIPNANLVLGGSGVNRTITVTPAANQTGTSTITVTVTDGDGDSASDTFDVNVITPALLIDNYALVDEGNTGTVDAVLTVLLNSGVPMANGTVTVHWTTANTPEPGPCASCATAVAGQDYVAASGTLTFNPGETSKTITIAVKGDTLPEVDEGFFVRLDTPVNSEIANGGVAVVVIFDDDFPADRSAEFVRWMMPVGVDGDFGQLFKNTFVGWNSGAASAKALTSGDGGMEFTAGEADTVRIAGLSHGNTDTHYNDIDFGIELYFGSAVLVTENAIIRGGFGTYVEGDRFGIAVENGVVVYRKNGVAFYTSGVPPTYPLGVDTALYTDTATLYDVVLTGRLPTDVFFTNIVGVNPSFSGMQKFEVDGWNAGAASDRALVTGDGYMEFTATEEDTTRMIGLSSDNASVDYSDIDFGIYLYSNRTIYVVEGGTTRGHFGTYATGDRFQVAVEGGVVKYRHNGILMYTSGGTPTYPLLVDAALFTEDATIDDVALSGAQATDVDFVNLVSSDVCGCGNSLAKISSAPAGWNAGAISSQTIVKGNGFVEFEVDDFPSFRIAGLSHAHTSSDFSDIDFGVLLGDNFTYYVFEGGVNRGVFGTFVPGDRFRVSIEAGVVKYRRNGVLFYTSGGTPIYPLLATAAIYTPGGALFDTVIWADLGEPVSWTSTLGVSASTGALTKTAAMGWNAGAVSTRKIGSGDGFVTFSTDEATTHKIIGLSNGNTNTDYTDVDFGILLSSNGTVYVFESGAFRGLFGTYQPNDRFQVGIEGGVVKYRKNGAVIYTGAVPPTYPLLVDTALFTPGSTLTKVTLGCVTAACQ